MSSNIPTSSRLRKGNAFGRPPQPQLASEYLRSNSFDNNIFSGILSKMSIRLEFGKPNDPFQALIRLPDRQHQEYEINGSSVEHLTHFKEALVEIAVGVLEGKDVSLEHRWLPLEIEDMKLLEKMSFYRSPEPIITANWEFIRDEHFWADYLPRERDGEYRWWQVSKMLPSLNLPKQVELMSVETNTRFESKRTLYRYDEFSTFDLFVLKPEELQGLTEELKRFGR